MLFGVNGLDMSLTFVFPIGSCVPSVQHAYMNLRAKECTYVEYRMSVRVPKMNTPSLLHSSRPSKSALRLFFRSSASRVAFAFEIC